MPAAAAIHLATSSDYKKKKYLMRLLDFMKEKKQKLFGFAQIDFIDEGFRQFSPHFTELFHTQPIQQPPYEPTLTGQTSYIARIVPDTVLSDRCEKFSRQSGSVASTGSRNDTPSGSHREENGPRSEHVHRPAFCSRPPRRCPSHRVPVNGVSAESLGHISGISEGECDWSCQYCGAMNWLSAEFL
ncbi:hypothetical protein Tco_1562305 [Tanacetum coccineum]